MRAVITFVGALFMLTLYVSSAHAQNEGVTWAPLELFGCTFNGNADMDDLNAVIESWNEWMDENGSNDYTAVVLSPHFTAASFPFDVLWIGIWQNGAAMAGLQQWLTEGGEIQEDFSEVIDCSLHQGFAVNNVKQPVEATGVVPAAFSNCTVNEGRTGPEGRAAIVEWASYLAENGVDSGHWILRPAAGEAADADYTFKWVRSYPSWEELGEYFELVFNGGGFQRLQQISGRVMSCDSPRVYNTRIVREMADD